MHRDRYIFLVNENARAIACLYDPNNCESHHNNKVVFKTLDPTIKKDDLVIIPTSTRAGFTVVKVHEADVDLDVKSDQPLSWIAAKFDKPGFDSLLAQEAEAMAKIRSAELRKQRAELRENLMGVAADEIGTLAIAHIGDKPAE